MINHHQPHHDPTSSTVHHHDRTIRAEPSRDLPVEAVGTERVQQLGLRQGAGQRLHHHTRDVRLRLG